MQTDTLALSLPHDESKGGNHLTETIATKEKPGSIPCLFPGRIPFPHPVPYTSDTQPNTLRTGPSTTKTHFPSSYSPKITVLCRNHSFPHTVVCTWPGPVQSQGIPSPCPEPSFSLFYPTKNPTNSDAARLSWYTLSCSIPSHCPVLSPHEPRRKGLLLPLSIPKS